MEKVGNYEGPFVVECVNFPLAIFKETFHAFSNSSVIYSEIELNKVKGEFLEHV